MGEVAKNRLRQWMFSTLPGALALLVAAPVTAQDNLTIPGEAQDDLTHPVNNVATSSQYWSDSRHSTHLRVGLNGFSGTFHTTCAHKDFYHAQHIVRLPNKDGRAYFMVTQSNGNADTNTADGLALAFRTNPGVLDPKTDLLRDIPGINGEYVYETHFNPANPIGNWNHPGKMSRLGNVLLIAAQNWTSSWCNARPGTSEDAVLFYDVSDPEKPRYWGKLSASELAVDEVASLGFFTINNEWFLAVQDKLYKTSTVQPKMANWTLVGSPQNPPIGQHGINFNSFERNWFAPDPGTERVMFFDGTGNSSGTMSTQSIQFQPGNSWIATPQSNDIVAVGQQNYHANLEGWCSDTGSLYVANTGKPAIYCAELRDPHTSGSQHYNVVYQNQMQFNWQNEVVVGDFKTDGRPALAVHLDRLFLAHRGRGGNTNLFVASSGDGLTWGSNEFQVQDFKSEAGPALAVHKDRLFLAHRGEGDNHNIFVANSFNGIAWSRNEVVVQNFKTESSPALASFNGRLYLAHRGEGGNKNLFVAASDDGMKWDPNEVVVQDFKSESGPALAVFKGRLYLAHRGADGNKNLFVASSGDGMNWDPNEVVVQDFKSSAGPALTVIGDTLYLSHRGVDGNDNLFVAHTIDGVTWASSEVVVRDFKSSAGPALAAFGDSLFLAHRGKGDNDNIFVTYTRDYIRN